MQRQSYYHAPASKFFSPEARPLSPTLKVPPSIVVPQAYVSRVENSFSVPLAYDLRYSRSVIDLPLRSSK